MVKKLLEEYGHDTNWQWRFYKIDSEKLDDSKLVIMSIAEVDSALERKFMPFDTATFEKYCHIGEALEMIC